VVAYSEVTRKKDCRDEIPAHPPINQPFLGEVTICGKLGGDPFKSV
jgi:hypothetical protein